MKYLYISCLGSFYESDEELDIDDLYCDQCGDTDWLIGDYETEWERMVMEDEYLNNY